MKKKYVILVTYDPYGRDDGFATHAAKSSVLNNKFYDTKEEAEEVANEFEKETSHKDIEGKLNISFDLFGEIRNFVLSNAYLHVPGDEPIKNNFSTDKMITIFLNMYGLSIDYNEMKFREDEALYQRLMGDEPLVSIIEINK